MIQEFLAREEQIAEQRKMDKVVEKALDAVYDKWDFFQGYDPEGYLECYKSEMKLQGVLEDRMIVYAAYTATALPQLCISRKRHESWGF